METLGGDVSLDVGHWGHTSRFYSLAPPLELHFLVWKRGEAYQLHASVAMNSTMPSPSLPQRTVSSQTQRQSKALLPDMVCQVFGQSDETSDSCTTKVAAETKAY